MLSVSARFLAALRGPHAIALKAELVPPGGAALPVSILGGDLTVDVDANVRRQANLEIAFSLADPVTVDTVRKLPFGGYCKLFRGIRFADGSIEQLQLGYFRVENVTWPELQGRATLTLFDRMAQVEDEALEIPYAASGKKPSDAVVELVQAVFGGTIAYHVTTTPASEPTIADTVYDEARGDAIRSLAASVGAWCYFDNLGDFWLEPRPTGIGTPVWTFDTGAAGVMVSCSESLDRSAVRNGVSVRAQPAADLPPLYSLAIDSDPASPTRWGGPFGKVPLVVNATEVASQAAADSMAASLLNLRLGLSRTLELHGVPNPALQGGDLIEIRHADGRSETALVNSLALGLGPESDIAITTRTNWRPNFEAAAARPRDVRLYRGVEALEELAAV